MARLGHQVHVLAGSTRQLALTTSKLSGVFVHGYRASGMTMGLFRLFGRRDYHWTQQRLENAWCMYLGLKLLMREYIRHPRDAGMWG